MKRTILIVSAIALLCAFAMAQDSNPTFVSQIVVPRLIRFSGQVKATGTVGITFTLHKGQQDNAALWIETQNVKLDDSGKYTVLLGATKTEGIPMELFTSGEAQWLGIRVEGQAEQGRVLLVSVPYALKAAEADTLAGHSPSEFITSDKLNATVQQQIQLAHFNTAANKENRINGVVTDPATNFVDSNATQVVGVTQNGTGQALVATAKSNTAITGTASATTGSTTGVLGQSASTSGIGIRGFASASTGGTVGLFGSAASSSGIAIAATESATSGFTTGLQATVSSSNGIGAIIQNKAGGQILSGRSGSSNTEMFSVDGSGNIVTDGSLNSGGTVSGVKLTSSVATGTPPLVVASTTEVANLNASLLGGVAASALPRLSGNNKFIGLQTISGEIQVQPAAGVYGTAISGVGGGNSTGGSGGGVYGGGANGVQGGLGISGYGGNGTTGSGGDGGDFNGGTSDSDFGGYGVTGTGASSSTTSQPGAGVAGFGGSGSGTSYAAYGSEGLYGVGGNSASTNARAGDGAYVSGGTATAASGTSIGGQGITAIGGNSNSGTGGDGIDATGGTGTTAGWAGNFTGSINVSGTIYAGTKDFKIDHPLDPANKYLYHASVESSEMMDVYSGNVTTNAAGEATVRLPDWFEALNRDFRYQLTVLGQFAQAIVAEEIAGHQFQIKTDKPNVKVSWLVTGVRHDAFAEANPLHTEVDKPEIEKGYYIHPELYGAAPEKQIEWSRHPQLRKQFKGKNKPQETTAAVK